MSNIDGMQAIQDARHATFYEKNYRQAFQILSRRLDEFPNDLSARAERALTAMTLEREAEMQNDIAAIMAHKPRTASDYDALGFALAIQGFTGPSSQAAATWKRAADAFKKSLQLDPQRTDTYRHRAQMAVWQQNQRAELEDLNQALKRSPDDTELLWRRSFGRSQMGNRKGALEDADSIIRIEPEIAMHYADRALLRDESDTQGQIDDYSSALVLRPGDVKLLTRRAMLYELTDQSEKALHDWELVLQMDPYNMDSLVFARIIYADKGDYARAVELVSRQIAQEPESDILLELRAQYQRALGNLAAAEEDEQHARRLQAVNSIQELAPTADSATSTDSSKASTYGQAGMSIAFVQTYWLAFVWIGLVVYTIVIVLLLIAGAARGGQLNTGLAPLLLVGIGAALFRGFQNGFRFRNEGKGMGIAGTTDSFVATGIAWSLQVIILTATWPFVELFRQLRFLSMAKTSWERGDVLIDDKGRPVRAG